MSVKQHHSNLVAMQDLVVICGRGTTVREHDTMRGNRGSSGASHRIRMRRNCERLSDGAMLKNRSRESAPSTATQCGRSRQEALRVR